MLTLAWSHSTEGRCTILRKKEVKNRNKMYITLRKKEVRTRNNDLLFDNITGQIRKQGVLAQIFTFVLRRQNKGSP